MSIKLKKKEISKRVQVTWADNNSEFRTNLKSFIQRGFTKIQTLGWLVEYNRREDRVVIMTERSLANDGDNDYTMIFWSKILEIEFL